MTNLLPWRKIGVTCGILLYLAFWCGLGLRVLLYPDLNAGDILIGSMFITIGIAPVIIVFAYNYFRAQCQGDVQI